MKNILLVIFLFIGVQIIKGQNKSNDIVNLISKKLKEIKAGECNLDENTDISSCLAVLIELTKIKFKIELNVRNVSGVKYDNDLVSYFEEVVKRHKLIFSKGEDDIIFVSMEKNEEYLFGEYLVQNFQKCFSEIVELKPTKVSFLAAISLDGNKKINLSFLRIRGNNSDGYQRLIGQINFNNKSYQITDYITVSGYKIFFYEKDNISYSLVVHEDIKPSSIPEELLMQIKFGPVLINSKVLFEKCLLK